MNVRRIDRETVRSGCTVTVVSYDKNLFEKPQCDQEITRTKTKTNHKPIFVVSSLHFRIPFCFLVAGSNLAARLPVDGDVYVVLKLSFVVIVPKHQTLPVRYRLSGRTAREHIKLFNVMMGGS